MLVVNDPVEEGSLQALLGMSIILGTPDKKGRRRS
jgi:hypothetical protein